MIKINDIYDFDIIDMTNLGCGVAKIDNKIVFINNTVTGDIVTAKITKINKNYLQADLLNIIKESSMRIKPKCPYYEKCGGCSFGCISLSNENKIKETYLQRLFKDYKLNPLISGEEYYYRNKVTLHVQEGKLGYYQHQTNNLVEIDNCLLLNEEINKIIKVLKQLNLKDITQIIIKYSEYYDELLIKFIGNIKEYDLLKEIPNVKSIYINDQHVYKNTYIKENIAGKIYTIYPNSFFQVNTNMIEKLYDIVKNYTTKKDTLLDLYCGTGTIGIYLSDKYNNILGIDIVKDSIKNANINKELNNLNNINFKCLNADDIETTNFDTTIVDPPRSGLTKKVINSLFKISPDEIIYVSCNPNTLKRDIKLLQEKYIVKEITPVNMFPRTIHTECVTLLQRKDK